MSAALYDTVAQATSKQLTERYSTSFSLATRNFPSGVRRHIYNIYGVVRIADEIVDTYAQADAGALLTTLESEVYAAIRRGYSANTVVHAFALTAREFAIDKTLIAPFFASMRMDAPGSKYRAADYAAYIHGSAEVVGLMCLRVFCGHDTARYDDLKTGASALGSAFQKINFLRDMADDHARLGRYYFPTGSFDTFDDTTARAVIQDIKHDMAVAAPAIRQLPPSVRPAVAAAASIYGVLVGKLARMSAADICSQRVHVRNGHKLFLFVRAYVTRGRYV